MKKSSIILLAAFLFFSYSFVNAQIKVSSTGKVKIGATTDATVPLEVVGDASISGDTEIDGDASITGNTEIDGDATILGEVVIGDNNYTATSVIIEHYYSGLSIEQGYYGLGIKPESTGCGDLGDYSHRFNTIYLINPPNLFSDRMMKENINNINNSLEKILQLQGVEYDFKEEFYSDIQREIISKDAVEKEKFDKERKGKIGLIAQDVNAVIPEVVNYDDKNDMYSITYSSLIPYLIESIKEQQLLIEDMQSEISELQGGNLKSLVLSGAKESLVNDQCLLHQNAPNPFGEITSIRYSLPEGTTNADIIIYDMTGKQLRRIPLTEDGDSSIQVNGGEMDPGMYMYSMIVENRFIDTKQMILTSN